jgi:aminoglycoside 2'-N-acetyltransferase I
MTASPPSLAPRPIEVRRVATEALDPADLAQLLDLFVACWPDGDFTTDDIAHAMGGVHWLAVVDGRVVGHVSVVPRELAADGRLLPTGYVEAVCTHPTWQGQGIARRLLALANAHIRETFDLGALSTDVHAVYVSGGWERWRGPASVRTADALVRTPDEDDGIMVLRTARTPLDLDVTGPISCEWRAGDAW